jgi:hypothetical protein
VVDAFEAEDIESLPDIGGRSLLAGVGNLAKSFGAGACEDIGEFRWRMAEFG